ncbi:MAG: hypothetical protein JWP52_4602 [Rhizobacter sp.]|nr:hypothetical protein [Rhizobacter sp.]
MSGLDNSQKVTDESSLKADEIQHDAGPVPGSAAEEAVEKEVAETTIATAPARLGGPAA